MEIEGSVAPKDNTPVISYGYLTITSTESPSLTVAQSFVVSEYPL
jgi:hypothetical protein